MFYPVSSRNGEDACAHKACAGSLKVFIRKVSTGYAIRLFPGTAFKSLFLIICLFSAMTPAAAAESLRISFIDVGYGDAVLLEFPGGENILIDSGEPAAADSVCRFLARKKIETLDVCIGTHTHLDHIGGFPEIVKKFPAEQFFLNREVQRDEDPAFFVSFLLGRAPSYRRMKRGDKIVFSDGSSLACLHPGPLSGDLNRDSLVVLAESKGCRFLFMGDAFGPAEEELLAACPPGLFDGVMAMKVGHHGWGDVSGDALLDAVSPRIAVISTGPSPWPLPPAWILDRFSRRDIPVLRTDQLGTIELMSDGEITTVKAGRKILARFRVNQGTGDAYER